MSPPIPPLQTAAHIPSPPCNWFLTDQPGASPLNPKLHVFPLSIVSGTNSTGWKIWSFHDVVLTFHVCESEMEWYKESNREHREGNQHLTRLDSVLGTFIYIFYFCKSVKEVLFMHPIVFHPSNHSSIFSTLIFIQLTVPSTVQNQSLYFHVAYISAGQWALINCCYLRLIMKSPVSRGKPQGIFGHAPVFHSCA